MSLSGWNYFGSDQMLGLRCNFQRFKIKCDPAEIWKPATLQSSLASWGVSSVAVDYGRNVSLTMACK